MIFDEFIKAYFWPSLNMVSVFKDLVLNHGRGFDGLCSRVRFLENPLHSPAVDRDVTEPLSPSLVN